MFLRAGPAGALLSGGASSQLTVRALLAGGAILLGLSLWRAESVPVSLPLRPELLGEPLQEPVPRPAFTTTVEGITYAVQPLYTYELYGLVVSRHDSRAWWDWIHEASLDRLNAVDLCVVWGRNLASGAYAAGRYSSGQFVCYYSLPDAASFAAFDPTAFSNNHLLTDQPHIARKLRSVRVGDQIRVRGALAEYRHDHGFAFKRGTSVRRDDSGNGACETIFVESLEILHSAGASWRRLAWAGGPMLGFGLLLWLRQPFRVRD